MKKTLTLTLMISFGLFMVLSPVFIHLVSYLHAIVWVVILFCIICIVGFWVLLLRKEKIHIPYPIFLSFLTLYTIALVILLFLRPTDQIYKSINLVPFTTLIFYLSGKVNWLIAFYNLAKKYCFVYSVWTIPKNETFFSMEDIIYCFTDDCMH